MKTILVIDDEKDLIKLVDFNLSKEGFLVLGAKDGPSGLEIAKKNSPDLVLLDLMLPGMDGLEVCKKLKSAQETARIPIIMLTAKAQETDRVVGLEIGADDYITKPFSPRELAARVKAILRRFEVSSQPQEVIKINELNIDHGKRTVTLGKKQLNLTTTEFNILWHLANRPGRVITRDDLISVARGDDVFIIDRNIDVHIVALRKKLGKYKDLIETIHGVGYKLNEDYLDQK